MKLHSFLNERIADLGVMYFKLHRYHWYVEGPHFYGLHEKYEELYDEATEIFDEFAERLLAIGGAPASTMKEYLALSKISEEGKEVTPEAIFETLIKDYSYMASALKEGIELAEGERDMATADMFVETVSTFEKHLWMFKQSLKG
ncbi:MAG: DNA starvation/stationary phase protection protein [Defluviitaleaceae bacterium]|nr:DNA starvation/stationary phase protection protein [Defluviitaleaceae bacterium]